MLRALSGGAGGPGGTTVDLFRLDETATPTLAITDGTLRMNFTQTGTVALALPAISGLGADFQARVVDIGLSYGATGAATNNITMTANGSDTINETATYVISADNGSYFLVANATTNNWELY